MRLGSIQFLRMIAALLIVYLHAIEIQVYVPPIYLGSIFREINELGIGVDIFFVISGFIISLTAGSYNGWRQCLHFLKKRFIRLNPVYYIALLISLAVTIHHMMNHFMPGYQAFLKSIFLLPVADATVWNTSILPVSWTLNFEWLFYILFALAIAIPVKNKPLFLIVLIFTLLAFRIIPGITDVRIWFITSPILLEFVAGIGICLLYRRSTPPRSIAYMLLIVGVGLSLCDMFFGSTIVNNPSGTVVGPVAFQRFLHMGIPATMMVSGCIFLEKNALFWPLWNNRYVQLLGNASYSLYLSHYITYSVLAALFVRLGPVLNINLSIFLWFLIAIINGILFYRYVETPLLHKLRTFAPAARVPN